MNWLKKKATPVMMEETKYDEITDSLGMLTKKIKDNKAWDESVKNAVDKLLKELSEKIVVQPASKKETNVDWNKKIAEEKNNKEKLERAEGIVMLALSEFEPKRLKFKSTSLGIVDVETPDDFKFKIKVELV